MAQLWDRLDRFLRAGIAGSEFTPLRLLTVITLTAALVWIMTLGALKGDLNFEVWRQLALAGVTIQEPAGAGVLGLHLVTAPKR